MTIQVAVCETASDAQAARAYWQTQNPAYVEVPLPNGAAAGTDVRVEKWSGWPANGTHAAVIPAGATVLMFKPGP